MKMDIEPKEAKRCVQSIARICKKLGKPEYAWKSHNESDCNIKKRNDRANNLDGDSKSFNKE